MSGPEQDEEIRGFVTIACLGHYREVVAEVLEYLLESRLYDRSQSIELAVLGASHDQNVIDDLIRPFEKLRVAHRSDDLSEYEYPALALLQDACRSWSGYVFYLHTKGVSQRFDNQYARYWRVLMLECVVGDHERCVDALSTHDCVGTNWRVNHYSGNFWWARSAHIRRLPSVRALRHSPRMLSRDRTWNARLQCEFWLAMARGRFKNLGVQGLDLYHTFRWSVDAADVINELLTAIGGDRYLELTYSGPSPYVDRIRASIRHVVSPHPDATFRMDEDAFLESDHGEPLYDVVFVDSWHDEERCLRALELSLRRVSTHGAIVAHDTNPPTAWHQRPATEFVPGSEWNGDVWKAVVRFRLAHPGVDVMTVDTDWGCTVIRPAVPASVALNPARTEPLTWDALLQHRAQLLNVVPVRRFRRDLYGMPFMIGDLDIVGRTDVINCLISHFGFERYLEVGCGDGENFARVIAPIRQSVDIAGLPTFCMTSDEFFARSEGCERYDLIFIDAHHEEDQCLRDIEGALGRLSAHGVIVVHDTNPPTEWHQRPVEEFVPGSDWNGTAWRSIVRFRRRHPDVAVVTLDVDWGCTIIRPMSADLPAAPPTVDLTWSTLCEHRVRLLNLRPPKWTHLAALA